MCVREYSFVCVCVCVSVCVCERERDSECMFTHLCGTGVEVGDWKDGPIKTNLLRNIKHVVLHK